MSEPRTSLVAQTVESAVWKTRIWSLGQEDPLEKEMATHSSILACKIPWTEEPGRPQSMGLQRVRHDWVPSPCLENSKDRGSWRAPVHGVAKSRDRTEPLTNTHIQLVQNHEGSQWYYTAIKSVLQPLRGIPKPFGRCAEQCMRTRLTKRKWDHAKAAIALLGVPFFFSSPSWTIPIWLLYLFYF